LMGGTVSVSSTVGQGSEFLVTLGVGITDTGSILQPLSSESIEAYYLPDPGGALLADTDVTDCGLQIHPTSVEILNSVGVRDAVEVTAGTRPMFLIDLASGQVDTSHRQVISALVSAGYHVGLVTDMPSDSVAAEWIVERTIPVLSHPFSPRQLQHFLADVLGGQVSDAAAGFLTGTEAATEAVTEAVTEAAMEAESLEDPQFVGHVLIVEDNEINQIVISDILSDLGLTYDLAGDGRQAVTAVSGDTHYDLVLMDVQMPEMDGLDATRHLRGNGYADLIICGLSANAMEQDSEQAYSAGMNDYLAKPVVPDEVVGMVSKYLRRV